ncbi:MAG: DUF2892 domain-containing protein [Chitinophagaceae bacterium]|nr:DUF2892 domain-containing protein [Chitinophagaceae bacterium]
MAYNNRSSSALTTINVSERERIASLTVGSALLVNAVLTGKRFRFIKGLVGAFMIFRGVTGYCPAYAAGARNSTRDGLSNVNIRTRVVVNKGRQEVYAFWRKLENLPFMMKHLASVKELDTRFSEWKLKVPVDLVNIVWKAEIVKDEPGALIGWQSVEGSAIQNAGKVEFIDTADGQTEVDVIITYHPPLGATGDTFARLLAPAFRKLIKADISNFKNTIESMEFPSRPESVS